MTDGGPFSEVPEESSQLEDLPERLRVHSLARALGTTSRQVLDALTELDGRIRSAHSTVERVDAVRVRDLLASAPAAVSASVAAAEAGAASEAEEPESRLMLETAPAERPEYMPLFVAPQPVKRVEVPGEARRHRKMPSPTSPSPTMTMTTTSKAKAKAMATATGTTTSPTARPIGVVAVDVAGGAVAVASRTAPRTARATAASQTTRVTTMTPPTTATTPRTTRTTPMAPTTTTVPAMAPPSVAVDVAAASPVPADDSDDNSSPDDPPNTVVHERAPRAKNKPDSSNNEIQGIDGSTRLEAKRQRRRDGRDAGRRRPPVLTEAEFLARREAVDRVMVVRDKVRTEPPHQGSRYTQIAVLEDGIVVEHFVTSAASASLVGNIYLGIVQNVLPSMEAAFVDIGRGRNGVLYAGEVNWEAAGLGGSNRKIEQALGPVTTSSCRSARIRSVTRAPD